VIYASGNLVREILPECGSLMTLHTDRDYKEGKLPGVEELKPESKRKTVNLRRVTLPFI